MIKIAETVNGMQNSKVYVAMEAVSTELTLGTAKIYAMNGRKKMNDWILCSEKMPEEYDTMFAKFKGTANWNNAMWEKASNNVNVTIEVDEKRWTETMQTHDGEWYQGFTTLKKKVIAWMPLPEPYKGGEL